MFGKFVTAALEDKEAKPATAFAGATAKLTIGSLDMPELDVTAQYNPKELQIERKVTWTEASYAANVDLHEEMHLEHSGTPTRSMTLELNFDCYENAADWRRQLGVRLNTLEKLATPIDPKSSDEQLRRPHHCVVAWGHAMPKFLCVIESLTIKTVMFGANGAPLRVVATVGLKEAHAVKKKAQEPRGR
ncbi:MAG: hypothetical protein KF773_16395 [Deltaproteobacteria bacterium]|nr:hypothetical protein [Deltaproteobacteria bacterium]MCW5803714.1 hypothetical protein [Deltaproteobacteria bacterium]